MFLPFPVLLLSVYEAGKAVKKGVASQYAPTIYAPSMYGQPAYSNPLMTQPGMPMLPFPKGVGGAPPQNGYGRDYDGASSGWHLLKRVLSYKCYKLHDDSVESPNSVV